MILQPSIGKQRIEFITEKSLRQALRITATLLARELQVRCNACLFSLFVFFLVFFRREIRKSI
jgi:hypothetical protein